MSLLILLLVLALLFGGGGFCCAGLSGGAIGLILMLCLVGHFAIGLRTEG